MALDCGSPQAYHMTAQPAHSGLWESKIPALLFSATGQDINKSIKKKELHPLQCYGSFDVEQTLGVCKWACRGASAFARSWHSTRAMPAMCRTDAGWAGVMSTGMLPLRRSNDKRRRRKKRQKLWEEEFKKKKKKKAQCLVKACSLTQSLSLSASQGAR